MRREQILPTILIVVDIGAALVYVSSGEWRRVTYWAAAAVLTWSVTW